MRVRYFCAYDRLNGYGRAARDYLAALDQVDGVELEIAVLGDRGCNTPEPRYAHLDRYAAPFDRVVGHPDVEIHHAPPRVLAATRQLSVGRPVGAHKHRPRPNSRYCDCGEEGYHPVHSGLPYRVAITTWETQPAPLDALDTLTHFDHVIVPSEFCADLFSRDIGSGSDLLPLGAVDIVPHCFDPDFWELPSEAVRENVADARDRTYRFYSVGTWGERKNMLGVLRAYLHEFTKRDRTQLMLLIDEVDFDVVRQVIAYSGIPTDQLPALFIPDRQLDERELVELHGTADCFVSATRGEGFGLGLFEAAVMGRRVISPLWGGQSDFLDDYAGAHAVGYSLTPCFGGASGTNAKQLWAEPDLESLANVMRSVYEDREPMNAELAREERLSLEQRFGYETIGPMLADKLREISAR